MVGIRLMNPEEVKSSDKTQICQIGVQSFSVLWMPILKEKACVLEAAGATKSPLSWPGMTMLYTDVHKRKTFSGRQRDILLIRVKLIIEFILSCPLLIFRLWAPKSRGLSQSGKV